MKLKLKSDGSASGGKKFKLGYYATMVGLTKSVFGGSLEIGGRFRVGAVGRHLASVAVKMFSNSI
jgi:hypothetical protein